MVNVWYRYPGSASWVLRGVGIDIGAGESVIVTGPNGSGKTTLLKVIAAIYKPVRGRVKLWGKDVWMVADAERLALRRRLVYVHEEPIIVRGSVLHNIAFGLLLRGVERETAEAKAEEAASLLGLEGLLAEKAKHLSRGRRQLVAIARAIALEPDYLLLDEPLSHLDLSSKDRLLAVLEELKSKGRGVVLTAHDTSLVERLKARLIYLEDGLVKEIEPGVFL